MMNIQDRFTEALNQLYLAFQQADSADVPQGLRDEIAMQIEQLENCILDLGAHAMDSAMEEGYCKSIDCHELKMTSQRSAYGDSYAEEDLIECVGSEDTCPACKLLASAVKPIHWANKGCFDPQI